MTPQRDNIAALNQLSERPVLARIWPDKGVGLTLTEALLIAGEKNRADEWGRALQAAQVHQKMRDCPIIATLGMLNAGKSSVVASFLSASGRNRLPRGVEATNGTHRFVYWVPTSWMDNELIREAFFGILATAHGNAKEFLSSHPDKAAEQYRSGRDHVDQIQIPLIAHDPALNALNAAFLDCPDVQTKDQGTPAVGTDNPRLDFITRAARLCSVFLLVWDRSAIRDRLFTEILQSIRTRMRDSPLCVLLNKIRPAEDQPTLTRNDEDLTRAIDEFGVRDCYGAFDFDIDGRGDRPGWRRLTPAGLVKRFAEDGCFPQFFSLTKNESENLPASVAPSRFLSNLPGQLDPAELQTQKLAGHLQEMCALLNENLTVIKRWASKCNHDTATVHDGLLEFCVEQFRNPSDDEPLQIAKPEFTEALTESFLRTAPRYLKPSLWCSNVASSVLGRGTKAVSRLNPLNLVRKSAEEIKAKLAEINIGNGRLQDAESLARRMKGLRWVPPDTNVDAIRESWSRVIKVFTEHRIEIDKPRLDEMTADVWKNLTFRQTIRIGVKGPISILGVVVALGGLLTAAVDGGATVFASYSLSASLAHAIPGITALTAAGAGSVGAFAGFNMGAMNLNTLPCLSLLFGLACEAFGVPSMIFDKPNNVQFGRGKSFVLPNPKATGQQTICSLGAFGLYKEAAGMSEYRKVLSQ